MCALSVCAHRFYKKQCMSACTYAFFIMHKCARTHTWRRALSLTFQRSSAVTIVLRLKNFLSPFNDFSMLKKRGKCLISVFVLLIFIFPITSFFKFFSFNYISYRLSLSSLLFASHSRQMCFFTRHQKSTWHVHFIDRKHFMKFL